MSETDRYLVRAGEQANLAGRDPADAGFFAGDKEAGKEAMKELNSRLEELQEMMYADRTERLLVVLQATDTGGKDGTISAVFEGVNPLGVKVASFKQPTPLELDHDYLWRVHPHVPGNGEITIFNRSHYEDVLVVRVREFAPEETWRRRFEHIRNFEQMLVDEGTTILKFFLHISKDEQRQRLQDRIDDPSKHWKFSMGDLDERKRWDLYQEAYEEAITSTSTSSAPWYVIPANQKWYRNIVIARVLIETLEGLDLHYPAAEADLTGLVVE